jgi:hypothetical protein
LVPVEGNTEFEERSHAVGSAFGEKAHRSLFTESRPSFEGIFDMQLGGVVWRNGGGHAPLGPIAGR